MAPFELGDAQPGQLYSLVLLAPTVRPVCSCCCRFLLGLDPVEANFEGTPEEVRLDPSDADLVDVIHTDAAPLIPFLGELCSAKL